MGWGERQGPAPGRGVAAVGRVDPVSVVPAGTVVEVPEALVGKPPIVIEVDLAPIVERAEAAEDALVELIAAIDAEGAGRFAPGFGPRLAQAVGKAERRLDYADLQRAIDRNG